MMYLAPLVERTEFQNILIVGKLQVGVLMSQRHVMRSSTISRDLFGSDLFGLYRRHKFFRK